MMDSIWSCAYYVVLGSAEVLSLIWCVIGLHWACDYARHKGAHPDATLGWGKVLAMGPLGWVVLVISAFLRLVFRIVPDRDEQGREIDHDYSSD